MKGWSIDGHMTCQRKTMNRLNLRGTRSVRQHIADAITPAFRKNPADPAEPRPGDGATSIWTRPLAVAVPFIAGLDDRPLLSRIVVIARVPLLLSLGPALIGLAVPTPVEHIIVGAVSGQLSTAMWKLLTYPTLLLLGIGFLASNLAMGRPFRWTACVLAGVTFDLLAAGFGVFVGILPAVTLELGWHGFFEDLYFVAVTVTAMGVMRILARMLYGAMAPDLVARRRVAVVLGFVLGGSALAAAFTERWPELSVDATACEPAPVAALR
jgi:hypothetical protein